MGKVSLKAVLRNFLNHFETLESRRKYNFEDDLYQREFQSLKELTEALKSDPFYSARHGLEDVNRRKNRYKDILPYNHSRVILSEYPGVPGSDYINANYVKGSTGSNCAYVASQGPLPNTLVDYWRMIWECEVSVIVMACNERESGKYKCESYWPHNTDQEDQYGNISVELVKWRQVCPDFLVRTLKIRSDEKERTVCQFHYTTWPDHGVPTSVKPILELVRLMRDVQSSESRPILIHCSAGCGRTGTICSIDYVWNCLRTGQLKEDFSLYNIISDMRRQRIAMVQTQEQYMLCYRAVAALFEQQLKMIDAHTYENVDEDGEPILFKEMGEDDSGNSLEDASISENFSDSDSESNCAENVQEKKDLKQPIGGNWKNNSTKINRGNSEDSSADSHIEENGVFDNNTVEGKIVGKATVIRRPSIAKLKAMFENMQSIDARPSQSSNTLRNNVTLLRSQSTRERSLSAINVQKKQNPNTRDGKHREKNLNECLYYQQGLPMVANSRENYTPWSKPYSTLGRKSFGNLCTSDILNSLNSEQKSDASSSCLYNAEREHIYGKLPMRESADTRISDPPPKPPRTYQYINKKPRPLSTHHSFPINNNLEKGHVASSVSLSRRINRTDPNMESHYGVIVADTNSNRNASSHQYSCTNIFSNTTNSNNVYGSLKNSKSTSNITSDIVNANSGGFEQNQYKNGHNSVKIDQSLHNPKILHSNYDPVYIRRDMSVPSLSVACQPIYKERIENSSRLQQKYVKNEQTPENRPIYRQPVVRGGNLPVTYVRPQPNPNHSDIEQKDQNKQSKVPSNQMPEEKIAVESSTCPNQSLNSEANPISQDAMKKTSKNAKTDKQKKQKGTFHFFFTFGRKKKIKPSNSEPSTSDTPSCTNTAPNTVIRPPHSHRFSPPTQWTQV